MYRLEDEMISVIGVWQLVEAPFPVAQAVILQWYLDSERGDEN